MTNRITNKTETETDDKQKWTQKSLKQCTKDVSIHKIPTYLKKNQNQFVKR